MTVYQLSLGKTLLSLEENGIKSLLKAEQQKARKERRDSDWIILTARHSTVEWVLHMSGTELRKQ